MVLDQVRDDLGVGLGEEGVAEIAQLPLEGEVVLDDPVVYDHHLTLAVAVRVRVDVAGAPVGGPAGVSDAKRAAGPAIAQACGQRLQLAHALADAQVPVLSEDSDARAVVAPILQPPQPLQKDWGGGSIAHIADDAAHQRPPAHEKRSPASPSRSIGADRHRLDKAQRSDDSRGPLYSRTTAVP